MLRALSLLLVEGRSVEEVRTSVMGLTCDGLGADMASVTMLVDDVPVTSAWTSAEAHEIDERQFARGGPATEAARRQEVLRIDDVTVDGRWPEFLRAAAAHDVRSTLCLPLAAGPLQPGALALYSRAERRFAGPSAACLADLAAQCSVVLANAHSYAAARELADNLSLALKSRTTIDHAIGVLMASGGRTADEAFQILVRASQRENRKLRDIAADLLERTQRRRLPPPPPKGQ